MRNLRVVKAINKQVLSVYCGAGIALGTRTQQMTKEKSPVPVG